jgi:hypothetical protein
LVYLLFGCIIFKKKSDSPELRQVTFLFFTIILFLQIIRHLLQMRGRVNVLHLDVVGYT